MKRAKKLSDAAARNLLLAAREDDFVAVTRLVIKRYGRWLTVVEAAKLATMSVRAFQRKLAANGVVFNELVDQARAELAVEMLQDSNATVDEISTTLGYSTASNFARAFERWTGQTPSEYRRGL